jgi:hypothetical protein
LKFLNIIDEISRACLPIRVVRSQQAVDVITTIENLVSKHEDLSHIQLDNGSGCIENAIREWCLGNGSATA